MKNKIFFTTLLLSLFTAYSNANAQAPGFMGKKFYIQGSILFFPAIRPTTVGNVANGQRFFTGVNYKVNVAMDYTVSRRTTLGAMFDYGESAFMHELSGQAHAIDHMHVGAYVKFHRGGALAPQGIYYRLGALVGIYQHYSPSGISKNMEIVPYLHQSFGKNTIIARRLILDVGFDLNLSPYVQAYVGSTTNDLAGRMVLHSLLYFRCGLGVLLF